MQNIEKERNSWLKLVVILFFISLFGIASAFSGDVEMNLDDADTIYTMKIMQVAGVIVLFIVPALLFAVLWTRSKIHYLGITVLPAANTTLVAALGMLMALPLINALAELNQHLHLPSSLQHLETWMKKSEDTATKLTEAFLQGTDTNTLLLNLFVIAFMAALSEELFFRGIVQKVLIECFKNKHIGVWIGAAIFSAFHMQFFGFIPRLLMGAYLGYLFLWTGSLWPGIVAHFMNNGLAVYVGWLINRGTIGDNADKVGENAHEWIYVVISAAMVIASLVMIYRFEKKRNMEHIE